jgi:CO/xanthine dehydrogenase FAD-binding subunit
MEFLRPATWAEALAAKAENPDAVPIAGGTDVMVELNFDRRRPPALLDLTRVPDLTRWETVDGVMCVGAGVTYQRLIDELGGALPGMAMAARTVGSPQIRNRGTIGGNLGSASPAGDLHPMLLAGQGVVMIQSVRGERGVPIGEFFTGPKRNVLAPDELIAEIQLPKAVAPQQFSKIGTRNAMVIAVCSFGLALHPEHRYAGTGIGSAAPTPVRAIEAELFSREELPWDSRAPLPERQVRRFGELVAAAAAPIDDVRGSARYRRHALNVLARRTLNWAWEEFRCA